ncbi:hypothetical protein F4809DRAFT_592564 [Biscogniauxia mediterranea]|nr:hypothetical protein F4809DRAFT_592564 [Biscogniauxia mediterranea]
MSVLPWPDGKTAVLPLSLLLLLLPCGGSPSMLGNGRLKPRPNTSPSSSVSLPALDMELPAAPGRVYESSLAPRSASRLTRKAW